MRLRTARKLGLNLILTVNFHWIGKNRPNKVGFVLVGWAAESGCFNQLFGHPRLGCENKVTAFLYDFSSFVKIGSHFQ